MEFVIASYIIVYGAIGVYWWSLIFRITRIKRKLNSIEINAEMLENVDPLFKD